MANAPAREYRRFFLKTTLVVGLAAIPFYSLLYSSYLSLTNSIHWLNLRTLGVAGIWLVVISAFVYFRSVRTGKLGERLSIAGSGFKGVLTGIFGLIATSALIGTLSVTAFYWVASHTPFTSERTAVYEVVSNSSSGRSGRTVRLLDEAGTAVHVRFGPFTWGDANLDEGDSVRIRCRGLDQYCRVIEWQEI